MPVDENLRDMFGDGGGDQGHWPHLDHTNVKKLIYIYSQQKNI